MPIVAVAATLRDVHRLTARQQTFAAVTRSRDCARRGASAFAARRPRRRSALRWFHPRIPDNPDRFWARIRVYGKSRTSPHGLACLARGSDGCGSSGLPSRTDFRFGFTEDSALEARSHSFSVRWHVGCRALMAAQAQQRRTMRLHSGSGPASSQRGRDGHQLEQGRLHVGNVEEGTSR